MDGDELALCGLKHLEADGLGCIPFCAGIAERVQKRADARLVVLVANEKGDEVLNLIRRYEDQQEQADGDPDHVGVPWQTAIAL
jgi:hypothetical protein